MRWLTTLRDRSARQVRGWRQQASRVAEQTLDRARAAGRKTAAQILRIQQAAGVNRKLAQRSLESVRSRQHDRPADAAFRDAYVARAEMAVTRQPQAAPAAAPQPAKPLTMGAGHDREAGQ